MFSLFKALRSAEVAEPAFQLWRGPVCLGPGLGYPRLKVNALRHVLQCLNHEPKDTQQSFNTQRKEGPVFPLISRY